jgi:hypothetical protein
MALPTDTALPFENTPAIERAVQWALEALFTGKQPSQEDLDIIATSPRTAEPITALCEALEASKGDELAARKAVKKTFAALCYDIDAANKVAGTKRNWLKELRELDVPSRTETETEGEQSEDEDQELPHGIHIGKSGKFVFTRMSEDDVDNLPDISFRIQLILPEVGVTLVYGPSGTGKTFVAYHTAQCLARGMHWFGRRVTGCKVLYIYAEGKLGLKLRQKAWYQHYQEPKSGNLTFIGMPIHLIEQRGILIETLKEMIECNEKPDVVFVDTFSNCTSGLDQNLQKEVEPALRVCHDIRETYGLQVILIHHTNKSDDFNGSQAFKNHVDTMIKLSSNDSNPSSLLMECEKQRDGADKFPPIQLELLQVDLGINPQTFDPVSSAVVITNDREAVKTTKQQRDEEVQKIMLESLVRYGEQSKATWQGHCKDNGVGRRDFDHNVDILLFGKKIVQRQDRKRNNALMCRINDGAVVESEGEND